MKTKTTKPSPTYSGNTRRRVRCLSGAMGERSRLQSRYSGYSDFVSYALRNGLTERLGFHSEHTAWMANPVIESSVVPSDFRVVFA